MVDVSKCKAKEPSTCPYHGAALRMSDAISTNNLTGYLKAREDFEEAAAKNKRALRKPVEDFIAAPTFNPTSAPIHDDILNMDDTTFVIDDHTKLIVQTNFYNRINNRKTFTAWMQVDGKNIGMLRYLIGGNEYDFPAVGDIEIRESHRGKKLGLKLITLVEEHVIHAKLYTSGGFTPEGFKAFAGTVPVYPSMHEEELKVKYRSMNFVHDWDALELEH